MPRRYVHKYSVAAAGNIMSRTRIALDVTTAQRRTKELESAEGWRSGLQNSLEKLGHGCAPLCTRMYFKPFPRVKLLKLLEAA